ncbi:MAG: class I SAM-dependent methyltransferase, partial [Candidatus Methylomirabilales bacterium]
EQEQVKEHFRKQVAEYVGLMRRIVPQYMEQQKFLCELIPFDCSRPIRVLDLGSGPGVLSELVLKRYPEAQVIAFDLTEEMLTACKQRLSAFEGRFDIRQGDFRTDSFGTGYDAILAGLTLHHLDNEERQEIYSRLYGALKNPGVFLAREVVVDEDPFVSEWHYSLWRAFMRTNGEDDAFWYGKHREKDHPASVEQQLAWLRRTGFVHTACHWRYWNCAIISGHKA